MTGYEDMELTIIALEDKVNDLEESNDVLDKECADIEMQHKSISRMYDERMSVICRQEEHIRELNADLATVEEDCDAAERTVFELQEEIRKLSFKKKLIEASIQPGEIWKLKTCPSYIASISGVNFKENTVSYIDKWGASIECDLSWFLANYVLATSPKYLPKKVTTYEYRHSEPEPYDPGIW